MNRNVLHDLRVRCPDAKVQARIADILSAYDDLIENNRRRMTLLEEAARQLYREWFVRFRFPGHEHAGVTNDLPEGWRRIALVDACESLEDGDWVESRDQGVRTIGYFRSRTSASTSSSRLATSGSSPKRPSGASTAAKYSQDRY